MALFKITIATQNALLAGLTQARDDDGVIDFDTCVDTSDKGRVEALIALHALFQRKLEEQMDSKRNLQSMQQPPSGPKPAIMPATPASPTVRSPEKITTQQSTTTNSRQERIPPSTPEPVKTKRSRTLTDVVFRRKESQQPAPPSPGSLDDMPLGDRQETSAAPQNTPQEIISRSPRKNTRASTSSSATWSSADSRSSIASEILPVHPPPSASLGRSPTTSYSVTPISRQDTSLSTFSAMSTASTLAPITKFGGCCKNAHEVRDGSTKKGLSLAPLGLYGQDMLYKCASIKCQFAGKATYDKKGWRIDDRILTGSTGLEYRWLFLVKSHMQQHDPQQPSFRCLICTMLGDESAVYSGRQALLSHVAGHQGGQLGGTRLEGPLIFSNQGAHPATDDTCDLRYPTSTQPPERPPENAAAQHGAAVVVAAMVSTAVLKDESAMPSKSGMSSFAYEADVNPWAA
jgi:hypothetical protein